MTEQRRTFLKTIGGTTVALTLAGCGQSEDETNDGGGDMSDEEGSDDAEDTGDTDESEDSDESEESEPAGLNVAHLSPDAPNVDVYVDGDAVLEDVPFRTFSDYLELTEGEYDIEITAAGDPDAVVFDETVELGAGDFTAAAVGELAEENQPFGVEIFETDRELPEDAARVRAIHASPDAPNVDITVAETGDALFEDVAFGAAGSVEVPEGAYTLEIRPATENNDGDVVASFDVELAAGTVYTAAAVGYLDPDSAPADEPFDLELAVDAGEDDFEPPEEDVGLGVAHLSPDAPNVDVYVDGDAVLEDVPFRTFSDYLELTEGEYDIQITAAGDPDTVVFDQTVEVTGDTTAAAVGELAEDNQPFSVELLEVNRELPDGARVRAVHASPDAPNVDITVAETGDALFEDVPFGAAASVEVPEGAYTLEIRPAAENNDGDVVASFDVELATETVYTAAAVGYLDPDSAPADEPFDLELAVDAE